MFRASSPLVDGEIFDKMKRATQPGRRFGCRASLDVLDAFSKPGARLLLSNAWIERSLMGVGRRESVRIGRVPPQPVRPLGGAANNLLGYSAKPRLCQRLTRYAGMEIWKHGVR